MAANSSTVSAAVSGSWWTFRLLVINFEANCLSVRDRRCPNHVMIAKMARQELVIFILLFGDSAILTTQFYNINTARNFPIFEQQSHAISILKNAKAFPTSSFEEQFAWKVRNTKPILGSGNTGRQWII